MVGKDFLGKINMYLNKINISQALFTLIIFFVAGSLFVDRFFSFNNLINVFRQGGLIFSFSVGMALAMMLAGLDLSIGAVAALSTVLAANLISSGNIFVGIMIGIIVGLLCGMTSGFIISSYGVPPFIMTFGMMKIANGLALQYTKGEAIYGFPEVFRWLGVGSIGIFPAPLLVALIILIIVNFLLKRTVFGRSLYAVGDNRSAAMFSGIPYKKTILIGYALSGLFSGIAGLLYIARLGSAEGVMGGDWPLQAIAACVLGGVSFAGGLGTVTGTATGALSVAILYNVLNLLGVSSSWQQFLIGFVIIFVISIDFLKSLVIKKRQVENSLKKLEISSV